MTRWIIVYKIKGETKPKKYCYTTTPTGISQAITKMFKEIPNIELVQIKEVVI